MSLLRRWGPPLLLGAALVLGAALLRPDAPPPEPVVEVLPGVYAVRVLSALSFWIMLAAAFASVALGFDAAGRLRRWGWVGWIIIALGALGWLLPPTT
jgi:hypothetical protein